MTSTLTIRLLGQLTFNRKAIATHFVAIGKALNLLNHASAKRTVLPSLNSLQRLLKTFPGTFAVDNPKRAARYFILELIIHSNDPVNININT